MKTAMRVAMVASWIGLGGTGLAGQQPAPTPAPAPRQGPPGPPPGGERMERMGPVGFGLGMFSATMLLERREALGLTADQVTRLSNLENELRQAREKAQTDAKPHREELEKLMQQATPDPIQLRTHAQALMAAMQGAALTALTTGAQAKAVLTPEQRGRVQGWADARRERSGRGGPMGRGFRRGPGGPPGPGGPDGPRGAMFRRMMLRRGMI